jgi:hypothetical protein
MYIEADKFLSMGNVSALNRHWHAGSEDYSGCDAFLAMLDQGWQITDAVLCEKFYFASNRQTQVYHFLMTRNQEKVAISVVSSPLLLNIISRFNLPVLCMEHVSQPAGARLAATAVAG